MAGVRGPVLHPLLVGEDEAVAATHAHQSLAPPGLGGAARFPLGASLWWIFPGANVRWIPQWVAG
jgi:hypothetical protein